MFRSTLQLSNLIRPLGLRLNIIPLIYIRYLKLVSFNVARDIGFASDYIQTS